MNIYITLLLVSIALILIAAITYWIRINTKPKITFDLESLDYPMFSTTDHEKSLLRQIIPAFEDSKLRTSGICNELNHLEDVEHLLNKIDNSLPESCFIPTHLGQQNKEFKLYRYGLSYKEEKHVSKQIRIIWINKLLAYKG